MKVSILLIICLVMLGACRLEPYQTICKYENFTLSIDRARAPTFTITNTSSITITIEVYSYSKPLRNNKKWDRILEITLPKAGTYVIHDIDYSPKFLFKTIKDDSITYDGYEFVR